MIPCQVAIQAKLQPAGWLPTNLKNMHRGEEEWSFESKDIEAVFSSYTKALEGKLSQDSSFAKCFKLKTANEETKTITLHYLTPGAKWLDIYTLEFSESENGVKCKAVGMSTGIFPLILPLAPVLNVALFWLTFHDHGFCEKGLEWLRSDLGEDIAVSDENVELIQTSDFKKKKEMALKKKQQAEKEVK